MASSANADLPQFKYTELKDSNRFRILKLKAANEDQDLECELLESSGPLPNLSHHNQAPVQDSDAILEDYEALSWTWGEEKASYPLRVAVDNDVFCFNISPNLENALRALRDAQKARYLWVDAICINQKDLVERNTQVPNMDRIYGNAKGVCVWLGNSDERSETALRFIEKEVLNMWEFDKLCTIDKDQEWAALIELMTRPWFSRRWVIQEIALASNAKVYAGRSWIDWVQFADAVSLFVEVESATRRLSGIMKKSPTFNNLPNFFGDVTSLGAARLVGATSNLFRPTKAGAREPLLTLEDLVSDFPVFESSEPRDIIYALLAIARDTIPYSPVPDSPLPRDPDEADLISKLQTMPTFRKLSVRMKEWARRNTYSEDYNVDYSAPIDKVYKEFISFSIRRSDQARALDIICRPWAPILEEVPDPQDSSKTKVQAVRAGKGISGKPYELPSWIPTLDNAAFSPSRHNIRPTIRSMDRRNANPLVGVPNFGTGAFGQREYRAAGSRPLNRRRLEFKQRQTYHSMYVAGFVLDTIGEAKDTALYAALPSTWRDFVHWINNDDDPPQEFWRTLVADRGPGGRNPPLFYARACKEAVQQGWGDSRSTEAMIDHSPSTIVVSFLRRVQSVIWNRRLIRTSRGDLGLVNRNASPGDHICILYGCSVPVVLQRVIKEPSNLAAEIAHDERLLEDKQKLLASTLKRLSTDLVKRREFGAKKRRRSFLSRVKIYLQHSRYLIPVVVGLSVEFWRWPTIYFLIVAGGAKLLLGNKLPSPVDTQVRRSREFRDIAPYLYYTRLSWPLTVLLIAYIWGFNLYIALLPITLVLLFPNIFLAVYIDLWQNWAIKVDKPKLRSHVRDPHEIEYWVIKGECYIHGMMNGEAIEVQNSQKIKARRFEIR
ncbi:MAG: hypothetical protein MMC23_008387 [Stictis urceolatum]|nr:hypothetical protein [Stictis urceolata]